MYSFKLKLFATVDFIFYSCSWSTLYTVGTSRVAKLTILAPLIGYLIIYNGALSDLIKLAVPLNTDTQSTMTFLGEIHNKRMDFLYFGLIFVGIGVGLFNIFAPSSVKRYPDEISFVEDHIKISTPLLVRNSMTTVIHRYLSEENKEKRSPFHSGSYYSFPDNLAILLHSFVERLYREADFMDGLFEKETEPYIKFETASGYVDTSAIMETMISGRRVDRCYWEELLSAAERHPKEVYVLEYMSGKFSQPYVRIFCSFMILVGFSFMMIPTVIVSFIIVSKWFL